MLPPVEVWFSDSSNIINLSYTFYYLSALLEKQSGVSI